MPQKLKVWKWLMKGLAFAGGIEVFGKRQVFVPPGVPREKAAQRGLEHD